MRKDSVRPRVVVVATRGTPIFELAVPCEVFGVDRSDLTPAWYRFELVAESAGLTATHGLQVPPGRGLAALEDADTVIVPACASVHEGASPQLVEALVAADRRGARIASLCSGAFVLAQAGLLDHRRATTHWMHARELAARYPRVHVDPTVLYVHDHVWTSAGSAAALDLCLELVRTDHGSAVANEVARRIVVPPHRSGGQAQYMRPAPRAQRTPLSETLEWARGNLASVGVSSLAAHAGISPRTLHRTLVRTIGQSPQQWLHHERVYAAQELLETTDLTVDVIAARTGFGTSANLRAHFVRAVGTPPSQYRGAFAAQTRPRATPAPAGS